MARSPQSPRQPLLSHPALICVFEIERETPVWLNSPLLFFPPPLVSLWLNVFYLPLGGLRGGWGRGRRREETRREATGGLCGTSRRDERGLSLFNSPRLPLFSCLRHLIKQAWIVDVTLSVAPPPPAPPLFLVSHPHILPSLPPARSVSILSSIYLWPQASVHPFTRSQCCSVTADRRSEGMKNKLEIKPTANIKAPLIYFLYPPVHYKLSADSPSDRQCCKLICSCTRPQWNVSKLRGREVDCNCLYTVSFTCCSKLLCFNLSNWKALEKASAGKGLSLLTNCT